MSDKSVPDAIFMIEGGRALEMVRQHIADRQRVREEVAALANELGIKEGSTDRTNGCIRAVVFEGATHPDFCKPKKRDGTSYPKRGTVWSKRFGAQTGYRDAAEWISSEFKVPLSIKYKSNGTFGEGWFRIGSPLTECGFLFMGENGPFALWVPDVAEHVARRAAAGAVVDEPAASFKMEFDGCRRIAKEEWEILVLQHKLDQRKAALAEEAA